MDLDISKAKELMEENINSKILSSYLIFINNYTELTLNKENLPFDFPIDIFNSFCELIKEDLLNLKEIANSSDVIRQEYANKYSKVIEDIFRLNRELELSNNQLKLLRFIGLYNSNFIVAKSLDAYFQFNVNDFIKHCRNYLVNYNALPEKERHINLLSNIPVRMARQKYFDYIRQSLFKECINSRQLTIVNNHRLKRLLFPEKFLLEEVKFKQLKEKINTLHENKFISHEISSIDNTKYSQETINDIYKELENIHRIRRSIIEPNLRLINIMFETCMCMMVMLTALTDWDRFFDDKLLMADLFYTIKENSGTELEKEFLSEVGNRSMSYISDIVDKIKNSDNVLKEFLEKNKKFDDIELKGLVDDFNFISSLYYNNLSLASNIFEIGIEQKSELQTSEIIEVINSTVKFLEDSFKDIPIKKVKIMRQYTMSLFASLYSTSQLLSHLKASLTSADRNYNNMVYVSCEKALYADNYFSAEPMDINEHDHVHGPDCDHTHD